MARVAESGRDGGLVVVRRILVAGPVRSGLMGEAEVSREPFVVVDSGRRRYIAVGGLGRADTITDR